MTQIEGMSVKELKKLIEGAGLSHGDCFEMSELRERAVRAAEAVENLGGAVPAGAVPAETTPTKGSGAAGAEAAAPASQTTPTKGRGMKSRGVRLSLQPEGEGAEGGGQRRGTRMTRTESMNAQTLLDKNDEYEKCQSPTIQKRKGYRKSVVERSPTVRAKEGWLYKKASGRFRSWQRRWFSINNHYLNYFTDDRAAAIPGAVPETSIDLRQVSAVALIPGTKKNRKIELAFSKGRNYRLRAKNQADATEWVVHINEFRSRAKAKLDSAMAVIDDRRKRREAAEAHARKTGQPMPPPSPASPETRVQEGAASTLNSSPHAQTIAWADGPFDDDTITSDNDDVTCSSTSIESDSDDAATEEDGGDVDDNDENDNDNENDGAAASRVSDQIDSHCEEDTSSSRTKQVGITNTKVSKGSEGDEGDESDDGGGSVVGGRSPALFFRKGKAAKSPRTREVAEAVEAMKAVEAVKAVETVEAAETMEAAEAMEVAEATGSSKILSREHYAMVWSQQIKSRAKTVAAAGISGGSRQTMDARVVALRRLSRYASEPEHREDMYRDSTVVAVLVNGTRHVQNYTDTTAPNAGGGGGGVSLASDMVRELSLRTLCSLGKAVGNKAMMLDNVAILKAFVTGARACEPSSVRQGQDYGERGEGSGERGVGRDYSSMDALEY